jgi:hypothetical protein
LEEVVRIENSSADHTYEIGVKDNENFFLANGILSSNCVHTIWIYPSDACQVN